MIHRGRDRYRTHGGIPHSSTNRLGSKLSFYFQSNADMAVASWLDQSSNGRDATQGTSGDQAALSGDGGLTFAVGDGDHYDLDSQVSISGEEGFTIFLVCEMTSVSASMCILGLNNTDHFLQFAGGGDNIGIKLAGTTTTITPSTTNLWHTSAGKFLITIQREAGDTASGGTLGHLNLWKNGVAVALDSVVENDGDGEFISLGVRNADRFFDGTIYDIAMVEAGTDTAAVRERINAYLTSKHGLI